MMKKVIIIVCLILSVVSCNTNVVEKPGNLIDKDKMVDILYDMSLLEAIKTQNINGGISNKAGNEYIYKKYNVDSAQFVKSNLYYASDIEEYRKMFEKVKKRLDKETLRLEAEMKKQGKTIHPKLKNPNLPQIE